MPNENGKALVEQMPIRLLSFQNQVVLDTDIEVEQGLYYPIFINCGARVFYRHQFAPVQGQIRAIYVETVPYSVEAELLSI